MNVSRSTYGHYLFIRFRHLSKKVTAGLHTDYNESQPKTNFPTIVPCSNLAWAFLRLSALISPKSSRMVVTSIPSSIIVATLFNSSPWACISGVANIDLVYMNSHTWVRLFVLGSVVSRGLSIPEQSGHRFHGKADTDSISFRTPIPFESGQ